jgi:ABC-type phosphate transport system permease subunit
MRSAPRAALRPGADWLASALVWGAALLVCAAFLWIVLDLLRSGLPQLSWSFLVESPRDAGRAGGIAPIVLSTLWILAVCLAVSVPLGTAAALLLAEFSSSEGLFARCAAASTCWPACPRSSSACSATPFSAWRWAWASRSSRAGSRSRAWRCRC